MSAGKTPEPVPNAASRLLKERWQAADADELIEHHAQGDAQHGCTSAYVLRNRAEQCEAFTFAEAVALHRAQAWPSEFGCMDGDTFYLNQHAAHSVQEFLHEAGLAWARHLQRMEALRGTPAGRIRVAA
ncbi:MAG: hypothetical protein KF863_10885 [Rubrivivax sp.]|nr:hypothetical protein [Rubrivivax sp.]